jgi:hypothetical protein
MKELKGLALVLAVAAVAGAVVAGAAPGAPEQTLAQPPAKQIAALKRTVAALKRKVATLQAENRRLAAFSPAGIAQQLASTKAALDKYQSVDQAKADGYVQASPCQELPTGGGESSHAGGMGLHYVSQAAMTDGKLDPAKPEMLVYAPLGGSLQLVAAEYFKPDADQDPRTDSDRPALFGRSFEGPMLGHAPGMPIHYDLHVWLWKPNPSGLFAPWSPDVSCKSP